MVWPRAASPLSPSAFARWTGLTDSAPTHKHDDRSMPQHFSLREEPDNDAVLLTCNSAAPRGRAETSLSHSHCSRAHQQYKPPDGCEPSVPAKRLMAGPGLFASRQYNFMLRRWLVEARVWTLYLYGIRHQHESRAGPCWPGADCQQGPSARTYYFPFSWVPNRSRVRFLRSPTTRVQVPLCLRHALFW